MKVEKQMKVGSRVRLKEEVDMGYCVYTVGHEFNIVGESMRGFDLEDDDGNRIAETGLMHHKLELI